MASTADKLKAARAAKRADASDRSTKRPQSPGSIRNRGNSYGLGDPFRSRPYLGKDGDKPTPKASTGSGSITIPSAPEGVRKDRKNKDKARVADAAKRRAMDKAKTMVREDRRKAGEFKGKYWGPDEFKGNQSMINAWKAAGKPKNRAKFAKSRG